MGTAVFKITDENGNPLEGADISFQSQPGNSLCGSVNQDGSTDSNGTCSLDTECSWNVPIRWTVTANGYQSQSGTTQINGWYTTSVNVALPQVYGGSGNCPPGYSMVNGQCVQDSGVNLFSNISAWLTDNWLLLLLIVGIILIVFIVLFRPNLLTQISKTAATKIK